MLGQKEIFQCLIIAILLSIFNFYRSAIRRNEEIQKYKKLNKKHFKLDETNKLMDTVSPLLNEQLFAIVTHSLEFKNEYCCDQDCFEFAYEHYLKQQCSLNCCIFRNVTNNHPQDENHIQMDELKIIETNVTNIETTSALPTPPLTLDYIKTNLLDEDSPKNDENVILEDEYVHPIKSEENFDIFLE